MRKREYKLLRRRLRALETVKLMLNTSLFASKLSIVNSQMKDKKEKEKLIAEMVIWQEKHTVKQVNNLAKINSINA